MTRTKGPSILLHTLNPEQRRAAVHVEGPLLVLAGAGSGKTRTLVHRIAHLIRDLGVDPGSIVALTFTNRAADEMRERVRAFAGDDARRVIISTFHALGVRILREHGERLGLPRRFAIYSGADQLGALRAACTEISPGDDRFDLPRILRRISHWKTRRISAGQAADEVRAGRTRGKRADDYAVLAADAYPRYEETLRAAGAVDFDDLLLLPVRLLEQDEEVCRALWRRWHYLMIDEYQDTNAVQLHFARLLAGQRRNLCVVGDDDQSIYAFRGADVGNILEFERHFPGAAVVTLEQNYRSTRRILAAANAVIAGNHRRHPKRLRTVNGVGETIDLYEHDDETAEAEAVAREIGARRMSRGMQWRDFAVLYRTNPQARPLEEALRAHAIPYRVVGGTSFFERREVADCLAYLRAVVQPADEIALRRIINYPPRGIGRTTVLRIADRARSSGTPFIGALRTAGPADVGAAQATSIRAFLALLDDGANMLARAEAEAANPEDDDATPLARWTGDLFDQLRIEHAIRCDARSATEADARVANVRDLVGTIARYERSVVVRAPTGSIETEDDAWEPPSLANALARLTLAELDPEDDERQDANSVVLLTLHSAKGLEFSDVFIVGLEEGILPHARAIADAADEADAADPIAEERRLLYVGITRARQRVTLTGCRTRRHGREHIPVLPSRFLSEIPEELLNVKTATVMLSDEESATLRSNFFREMRTLLAPEPEDA